MSVYIDEAAIPFGRMLMNHMVADTTEELDAMADKIGVARKWCQKRGTTREHYDVAMSKRALAIEHGALPVDGKDIVRIFWKREGRELTESPR